MSGLAVPKHKIEVVVVLRGGERRRVSLFLADAAPSHAGPERVADLLEGSTAFVPALDAESGEVLFLNSESVATAETAAPAGADGEGEGEEEAAATTGHALEVSLVDGRTVRGVVRYALPPERSRLTDFLNQGARFLAVRVRGAVVLVNKRDVARVAAVEG